MSISVAILIPVFNGLKYLKDSLPRIQDQIHEVQDCRFRIIITDDNSTDGTSEWLHRNYPGVTVLQGNGSLWWSGGINAGVKYALENEEFKYVLLWNHDNLCDTNYFKTLADKIPTIDTNTMIASKIFLAHHKPEIIFNMGAFFNPKTGIRSLNGYGKPDSEEFSKPVQVDWTGGMGTLIAIEIFHHIGLFDEKNFPQYYGDIDFFLRAKDSGYKLIVFPDLILWNDKSSSGLTHNGKWKFFFRSLFSMRSNYNVIIEYRFLRKHCKPFPSLFYFVFRVIKYFAVFLKYWLRGLF